MKLIILALSLFASTAQAEDWEHLNSTWGGTMHAYYFMDRDSISRSGITLRLRPKSATVTIRDDMLKDDTIMRNHLAQTGRAALSVTKLYTFEANCNSKEYHFQDRDLIYKGTQLEGIEDYVFEQICRPYSSF